MSKRLIALLTAAAAAWPCACGAGNAVYASVTILPSPDSDADGLTDAHEAWYGTDPHEKDTDGDTMDDGAEVIAGTSPTNAMEFFEIRVEQSTDSSGGGGADTEEAEAGTVEIRWYGVAHRLYTLQTRTNLARQVPWEDRPGWVDVPGSDGELVYTNDLPGLRRTYFRGKVR
jgi:hypothetical protein